MNRNIENKFITPNCSICSSEGMVVLTVEMPGVYKENLAVQINGDELRIIGTQNAPEKEGKFIIHERSERDFMKVFTLDETIDREKIDAQMEKGILTLTLHMKESVKPKKIEVKAG